MFIRISFFYQLFFINRACIITNIQQSFCIFDLFSNRVISCGETIIEKSCFMRCVGSEPKFLDSEIACKRRNQVKNLT